MWDGKAMPFYRHGCDAVFRKLLGRRSAQLHKDLGPLPHFRRLTPRRDADRVVDRSFVTFVPDRVLRALWLNVLVAFVVDVAGPGQFAVVARRHARARSHFPNKNPRIFRAFATA